MTAYTIPPNQTKIPLILNAGDTLTVDLRGRSTDVTVNDGATEYVNVGGSSFRTTVNDGGKEFVNGGTADAIEQLSSSRRSMGAESSSTTQQPITRGSIF